MSNLGFSDRDTISLICTYWGDFKVNTINWSGITAKDRLGQVIGNLMAELSWVQHVSDPIRYRSGQNPLPTMRIIKWAQSPSFLQ